MNLIKRLLIFIFTILIIIAGYCRFLHPLRWVRIAEKALTFMLAFNDLNGVPASGNEFRIKDLDLAFFNGRITATEPGKYDVWISTNSDKGLHEEFVVE